MVDTITSRASDFTSRDFDSWVLELRSRATSAFPGWTDFNKANFGNILLEMFAHTLDVLSYTQDQQHLERFIVFARLRKSMINLGKNVGFSLPGATVSSVDLEITIADGLARSTDIVIPKGTVVRTTDLAENIEFVLIADVTIPAGQVQVTNASAENAFEIVEAFVADGSPNLPVPLGQSPYVDNSAVVVIVVDTWEEQSSFLQSGPTDKHFIVDVDQNDLATMRFGDGINGDIPLGSGQVTYKIGGGEDGNVDANTLTEFRDGDRFPTLAGEEVQLLVRNPSAADGGVDRMSVEEARVAIPASLTTLGNRSVTQQDFENNARKVRGVARALMLTSDDDASIAENTGKLYIVPIGGGLPSAQLKSDVEDLINDEFPPTLTFTFTVEDPVLLIVSITATVYLNQGITESEARSAVEDSLDSFFALLNEDGSQNTQIDFGYKIRTEVMPAGSVLAELPQSDLINAVRDAANDSGEEVFRKVDVDLFVPADDVDVLDTEFPVLGSITLVNGDTALPF